MLERSEFRRVRELTVALVEPLEPEDCLVQAMPDVSPPKWHLAHTTWFFETFVLRPFVAGYEPVRREYEVLFNSYYEAVGERHPRPERGVLSRPTLREVFAYRERVDAALEAVFDSLPRDAHARIEVGIHHEQQHQELLLMDVKFNFSRNPLAPPLVSRPLAPAREVSELSFSSHEGGLSRFGDERDAFAYDNERPAHRRFVEPFTLADRLVTNGEFLAFIADRGYERPELWLSDGIAWVRANRVCHPLYWCATDDGGFEEHTLHGRAALDPNAPVCHVTGYEAAAYAEWAGARLPTEFEWELAATSHDPARSAWLEDGPWHPRGHDAANNLYGDAWIWTRSAYEPYPGYRPARGAVGEYNGKFMSNQWVLRGGAIITPRGHVRRTYRNFYYPQQRWPFTGIRLAKDLR
ncbi:MAG: ergothioneine biosynthesis protein EgtB [Planctomycetes bacterium]|nr:ergothioneine biosynthesis protein EgtB [Planctomycetota bacterium]